MMSLDVDATRSVFNDLRSGIIPTRYDICKRRNLTQAELGHLLDVSQTTVCKYVNTGRSPKPVRNLQTISTTISTK